MKSDKYLQKSEDYLRIEKAIKFIENNFKYQPKLDEIAESVHLSKYHFDRIFKRWAGISPIQFMQFITLDYTKKKLRESASILESALDAGLSGSGRLHDLFVTFDAMTPGEFKKKASGIKISYGFNASPFGECLIATTERGICYLGFVEKDKQDEALDQLFKAWPGAEFIENSESASSIVNSIFEIDKTKSPQPFNLHLKGTNFQINIWKAVLNIPEGWVVSYQDIAVYIGHPKSFRAVANAVAINPVAYLIPCHRVISKSGKIHQYRWGSTRKKALIGWEAAQVL